MIEESLLPIEVANALIVNTPGDVREIDLPQVVFFDRCEGVK
jgi:hypothetical protein